MHDLIVELVLTVRMSVLGMALALPACSVPPLETDV